MKINFIQITFMYLNKYSLNLSKKIKDIKKNNFK